VVQDIIEPGSWRRRVPPSTVRRVVAKANLGSVHQGRKLGHKKDDIVDNRAADVRIEKPLCICITATINHARLAAASSHSAEKSDC
jgi:hypothetical protein